MRDGGDAERATAGQRDAVCVCVDSLNPRTLCDILAPVIDPSPRTSAYYSASVDRFLDSDSHQVLGLLAAAHTHDLDVEQRQAWEEEIDILRGALSGLVGTVFLEFDVPRLGSRIDAVLVSGSAIFAIEFNARHSVEAISRHDAGARNLRLTSVGIEEIIERARGNREKAIVFVTGVPGAGKTLVGLNVATRRQTFGEARAVYLSGNGPLVAVLQEALTRDELARVGNTERKGAVRQRVKPFIQNVHHFRDEGVRTTSAPYDHVVIFDEAQRAWTQAKTSDFMRRRKKIANFSRSEPEFLISYLDRHETWAVVVCLVGGGQEIHTGEAGIGEWFEAVRAAFPHWRVYVSPNLTDSEYAAQLALERLGSVVSIVLDERLHLATSMRSFRSEKVSAFVKAVLDCDTTTAEALLGEIGRRYPIAVTRDLPRAKAWIRTHARGSEQYGLVASSQAQRLKPHAIDVRVNVDPVQWFLNDRHDTRSSYYLEDAATEFQVQGLELDWVCVTWDADLRRHAESWRYHSFRGDAWTTIHKEDRKRYLLNAYRVLLTRARQGMVIFVPPGDESDPTRVPASYNDTYEYLTRLGVAEV